uniref:Uncharacterized protein n=1 Tax=viral metagenome TaxID=1070528 RepID=A0A6C0EC84_9ZZZZ
MATETKEDLDKLQITIRDDLRFVHSIIKSFLLHPIVIKSESLTISKEEQQNNKKKYQLVCHNANRNMCCVKADGSGNIYIAIISWLTDSISIFLNDKLITKYTGDAKPYSFIKSTSYVKPYSFIKWQKCPENILHIQTAWFLTMMTFEGKIRSSMKVEQRCYTGDYNIPYSFTIAEYPLKFLFNEYPSWYDEKGVVCIRFINGDLIHTFSDRNICDDISRLIIFKRINSFIYCPFHLRDIGWHIDNGADNHTIYILLTYNFGIVLYVAKFNKNIEWHNVKSVSYTVPIFCDKELFEIINGERSFVTMDELITINEFERKFGKEYITINDYAKLSPDGKYITYYVKDKVYIKQTHNMCKIMTFSGLGFAWKGDSSLLAIIADNGKRLDVRKTLTFDHCFSIPLKNEVKALEWMENNIIVWNPYTDYTARFDVSLFIE